METTPLPSLEPPPFHMMPINQKHPKEQQKKVEMARKRRVSPF